MELLAIYPRLRYLLFKRLPYFLASLIVIWAGFQFHVDWLIWLGLVFALLVFALAYLEKIFTVLKLYEDRVEMSRGVINSEVISVPLVKITDSKIKHSFIDRLLGVATVYINTSGKDDYEIILGGFAISDLENFHDQLYKLLSEEGNKDVTGE
jgi:uncharacterized membrane protein YdbT with pleckstrin-like domain